MLPNPSTINKYLYVQKTPTWKVRSLYLFGLISWTLILYSYLGVLGIDPFYSWFVTPILILLTIYHYVSFGLNLFYRQFDLKRHLKLVKDYSLTPSVDIYLPICGEEMDVLKNTWASITKLNYPNFKVYVLDDSKKDCQEHKALAQSFGFSYFERPNKGEMKKAGNLKYAYERTQGDFIAIFDADFCPHPDFLKETLPHMDNPKVGIVQTPQYFDVSKEAYKDNPFAYNSAYAEEPFYRFIQVTRNRFGGSICCGSNALYRRSALNDIGGPYQIDYSEDAHTGFAMTKIGYKVEYIPVILAIGLCPDNPYAFFHQQHRWAMGSMRLMLSKNFWEAKISWKTKFCYITGFLFYLHHPVVIVFPFQLFWTLFLYNEYIPLGGSLLFYPNIIFAVLYLYFFPISRLKIGYFQILTARTYAYAHAVKTALLRQSVAWISTNAKQNLVSKAFHETTKFITGYVALSFLLILLAFRTGDIHITNLHYWKIQFWIFWNFGLSVFLLWTHRKTISEIESSAKAVASAVVTETQQLISKISIPHLSAVFALSYLFFEVVYAHLGFLLRQPVTYLTLPFSFSLFCLLLNISLLFIKPQIRLRFIASYFIFIVFSFAMLAASYFYFSHTYDTSWDGQGYHSNGIISFAQGWNPIYDTNLPVKFPDASIFVKGYPKALWLIQSSFYLTLNSFNAAKVTNLISLTIAAVFVFTFLRKLKINTPVSLVLALLSVFQAPFFMQFSSFMADQFSYEMILIAISSLGIFILDYDSHLGLIGFVLAEIFLVGTKFSNLPLAGVLGLLFIFFFFKKVSQKLYRLHLPLTLFLALFTLIFLVVPYGTNYLHYHHPFYPTNLPEISASYQVDNIPNNLKGANRLTQLFYSVFSESQLKHMGGKDPANQAVLKTPFDFSRYEVQQSAAIYNNRVGSAGPLFSGLVLFSLIIWFLMLILKPVNPSNKPKIILFSTLAIIVSIAVTLTNPAPNLLRYNGQIILIPFIIIVSAFAFYKNSLILKVFTYNALVIIALSTLLFSSAVFKRIDSESLAIDSQLDSLSPSSSLQVQAKNFYSTYLRLKDHNLSFAVTSKLDCKNQTILLDTSETTRFCLIK